MTQKMLLELLWAVLIVILPILTKYFVSLLETLKQTKLSEVKSDKVKTVIFEITDIIEKCVAATNQTYTDELKKQGSFTIEKQKEAFTKTFTAVKELLSDEVANFITAEYGNLDKFIETYIEDAVNALKK